LAGKNNMAYIPTSVIALDKSGINPLYYAVEQGQYTRTWTRYFSSQPIAFGTTRINGIDNGPGINEYDLNIIVTTWPSTSIPYLKGVTQTWDVQKTNLEASFKKVNTALYFLDPFGQSPDLDTTVGVYFHTFTETLLPQSTPQTPYIRYSITLTQTPPGFTI